MKSIGLFALLVLVVSVGTATAQQTTKYVFVDADCKKGFEVAPDVHHKRIITEITAFDFEDPAQALFAEDHIKSEFKASIGELYPASLNQFNGIYVYMLNDPESAAKKRDGLIAEYRTNDILLIDLQL